MNKVDPMVLPETMLQDLRYGARMFCRNVGVTTVVFSSLDYEAYRNHLHSLSGVGDR
jgi:hypothetical protein